MGVNWGIKDVACVLVHETVKVSELVPGDILVDDFGLFGIASIERAPDGTYSIFDAYGNGTVGVDGDSTEVRLLPAFVHRDRVLEDAEAVRYMLAHEASCKVSHGQAE